MCHTILRQGWASESPGNSVNSHSLLLKFFNLTNLVGVISTHQVCVHAQSVLLFETLGAPPGSYIHGIS